jgi:hypothetical protein
MAIVQQVTGRTVGFANPALYAASRLPGVFSDVVTPARPVALAYTSAHSGNDYLVSLDRDTSLQTAPGYDDVTGLGELSVSTIASYVTGLHH